MKVLTLDFDGVIANSQYECLVVGFNTYLKFIKNTKLFDGQKFTFNNFGKLKEKYSDIVKKYINLRPYVIDAFCFFVILHIIDYNIKIENQIQYNKLREVLSKQHYREYVDLFYKERFTLQDEDIEKWLELETPYEKIVEGIGELKNIYTFTVATNNRKRTVEKFLNKYQLSAEIITDSTLSSNKIEHLEYIKNKLNVNFNDIHFVDDQVMHFGNLLNLGVKCYLATWGYNNEEQQKRAKDQGAVFLNEDNFYRILAINH